MSVFLLAATAVALGFPVVRRLGIPAPDRWVLAPLVGIVICAVGVSVVGAFSLRAAQLALFGIAAVSITLELRRGRTIATPPSALPHPSPAWSALEMLALAAIVCANGMTFLSALAPIVHPGSAAEALAPAMEHAHRGRFGWAPWDGFAAPPLDAFLVLTTAAYSMGGETGAALLHWAYGALACGSLYLLGRRLGGRPCGTISAAMLATAPAFFTNGAELTDAMPLSALTAGALACLLAYREAPRAAWLLPCGIFTGAVSGAGLVGLTIALFLVAGAVVSLGRERSSAAMGMFTGGLLAVAAPWAIYMAMHSPPPAWAWTGGWTAFLDPKRAALLSRETVTGTSRMDVAMFPWNIVMRPHWFDGWRYSPGPFLFLFVPPAMIACGWRVRSVAPFAFAGVAALFFLERLAGTMLPFFVPLFAVAAAGALHLRRLRTALRALVAVTLVSGIAVGGIAVHDRLRAALGEPDHESYLLAHVPRYAAIVWAKDTLERDKRVVFFGPGAYYLGLPSIPGHAAIELTRGLEAEGRLRWLKEQDVEYLYLPMSHVIGNPAYDIPGYRETVEAWRSDSRHFKRLNMMSMPDAEGEGFDVVEIYELDYD